MKFGLDKVIGLIQIGLPPLLTMIKGIFSKKKYTGEEIQSKAQGEINALQDWQDSAEKEYKETFPEET